MCSQKKNAVAGALFYISALVFSALPLAGWASETRPPVGWRGPESADLAATWRDTDPLRYTAVSGDFDGNGFEDEARLMISDHSSSLGLFIFLQHANGRYRMQKLTMRTDRSLISAMGIRKVPTGSTTTACGKGYFECDLTQSEVISVPHPAVEYFKFEGFSICYYWDPKRRNFVSVWIDE